MYLVQELDSIHSTSAGERFALKKVGPITSRLGFVPSDVSCSRLSTYGLIVAQLKLLMLHMCLPVAALCVCCTVCQVIRRRAADPGCHLRSACRGSTGDIRHVQGGARQHPAPPSLRNSAHNTRGGAAAHHLPALPFV